MFFLLSYNYRRLYLNDNQITEVGRGTFTSITRIGTIDLARNQLRKIDFQMFSQMNYVEVRLISSLSFKSVFKKNYYFLDNWYSWKQYNRNTKAII